MHMRPQVAACGLTLKIERRSNQQMRVPVPA